MIGITLGPKPKNLYGRVMGISKSFSIRVLIMHFVDLAEVYAFGFVISDFKTIFHGSF